MNLDHAQLDMPAATVTRAMEYLVPANPLYDMLCTHLHLLVTSTMMVYEPDLVPMTGVS